MTASLLDAFPHVRAFKGLHAGYHFIASMTPITMPDVATLAARMPEAARRDLLDWSGGATLDEYLRRIVSREVPVESLIRHEPQPLLTDDRPYNEYCLLRRLESAQGKDVRAI